MAGVVVGGLLAGVPAYINNQETISAQSSLSSSDFVRSQRQGAYTKFIADEQTLSDLMVHLRNDVILKPGEQPQVEVALSPKVAAEFSQLKAAIKSAYDALRQDQADIALFGSTEVAAASSNIIAQYERPTTSVAIYDWTSNPDDELLFDSSVWAAPTIAESTRLRQQFVSLCRRDLGVAPTTG